MKVVEPGCGMGFFSLPLARMVGREGRVICVDLQQRMIAGLSKRAKKAGLADRIETVVCTADNLGLGPWQGTIDLVTAIHMIHEIPDQMPFFAQAHNALRASGRLLILEPKGHVTADAFDKMLELARKAGFTELEPPRLKREHTALLQKC
jgi:ubiquinone/menaquinone biosynthesis C-methylase UbiE